MNNDVKLQNFAIGTKIEMTVVDPIEGKLDIGFVSQLEGFADDNIVKISAPIYESKVYPVKVNSYIEAYLFHAANQIYRIAGYVTDRNVIDNIALLYVRVTEKPEKIQRRQYFRFECKIPVEFSMEEPDKQNTTIGFSGYTIDVSGGGLSCVTDKMPALNSIVRGCMLLGTYNLEFKGKVVRCNKEIRNEEIKYISSISFVDIDHKDRERVISFIFNKQRELLRRGLRGVE